MYFYHCLWRGNFQIVRLFDGRKKSESFECEELITLSKSKDNVLIVPPGVWFSFTTKKKKSVIANLINNPHSDKESIKSNEINGHFIKQKSYFFQSFFTSTNGEIPKIELAFAICIDNDGIGEIHVSLLQISLRYFSIGSL